MSFISLYDLGQSPLDIHFFTNSKGGFSVWFYPTDDQEEFDSVDIIRREIVIRKGEIGIYL